MDKNIPESAIKFEAVLKVDQYVLMVHGNSEEMAKARTVLENSQACSAA